MWLLAMDTAGKVCTTALLKDETVVAEETVHRLLGQAEGLLPQIEQLLQNCQVKKEEIGAVAVSRGPGSFTGLRIGLATAQALAWAWGCKLLGVGTLEALAYNLPVEGLILSPLMDAQKGNYYQALYRFKEGSMEEIDPVAVVSKEEALARAAACAEPAYLLGEVQKLRQEDLPAGVFLAPPALQQPKAVSVAYAALALGEKAAVDDPALLQPCYIRRSEAEELWERRQGIKSGNG